MKKALMVVGGWEGHEPKQCSEIFVPILRSHGFDVEVSYSLDSYLDAEKMAALSLVVPTLDDGHDHARAGSRPA
jgi:uncharacterized protein